MRPALRRYRDNLRGLRRNARLYLLAVLLGGLGTSIYMLFLNLYVDALGLSRQFLGNLQALSPLLNLVLALPMGFLSDRIGRKRALVIAKSGSLLTLVGFLLALYLFAPLVGDFEKWRASLVAIWLIWLASTGVGTFIGYTALRVLRRAGLV